MIIIEEIKKEVQKPIKEKLAYQLTLINIKEEMPQQKIEELMKKHLKLEKQNKNTQEEIMHQIKIINHEKKQINMKESQRNMTLRRTKF